VNSESPRIRFSSSLPARRVSPDMIAEEESMANESPIAIPRPTRRSVDLRAAVTLAWKRCRRDECSGLAAQAAYHILFAIFPLAIFAAALSALVDTLFGLDLFDAILASLASVLPSEARASIVGPIAAVVNRRSGWLLVIGIVTALWSGATAVGTFITALNRAYAVEETRPFWRRKGLEVLLTLGMGTAVTASFILIAFGGRLGTVIAVHVGLGTSFRVAWEIGRWPLIAVIITAALAVFYWIAPNIGQRFRWLSAGAILGTVVWILAMGGFGLYVGKFGQYDKTYGALGGVMILLLVFYISSLIVILGGELNGALARRDNGAIPVGISQRRRLR
jgi:membrane protein